jgi:hypothetical protein
MRRLHINELVGDGGVFGRTRSVNRVIEESQGDTVNSNSSQDKSINETVAN